MKKKLIFAIHFWLRPIGLAFAPLMLCLVCSVLPVAAQTATPEGAERKRDSAQPQEAERKRDSAQPQEAERKRDSAQPQEMVLIPAGKFWMGRAFSIFLDTGDLWARDKMDDRPANNIYVDAFYIDKYEVTNADYAKFVDAKRARAPWHWPEGQIPKGEEKFPVANVNWHEATDYCKSAGKRLPTEAEWEKAARGGIDRAHYSWGDDAIEKNNELALLSPQVALRDSPAAAPATLGRPRPNAVASFAPNGYGLYDMIGNVMEWTNDWYNNNYYPFISKQNPGGPETGQYKSVRGAGYADQGGHGIEKLVSYRNFSDPDTRMTTIGFRCAK